MRILFVVPYVPNLIRVRPYNLIRHLAARGHEVTVLTLWSSEEERADAEALKQHCHSVVALPLPRWRSLWNCLRALPTPVPLQAVYCWQPALAEEIARRVSPVRPTHRQTADCISPSGTRDKRYDVVHVEHLRGARYGLAARNAQSAIPVVWDSVDCISLLFEQTLQRGPSLGSRLKAWLDLERTRRYEGWLVRQFDRVLVTSQADRRALQDLALCSLQPAALSLESGTITVLANGVDLDHFKPLDVPRDPATLILTGKMSYHANVAAALYLVREIMPLIWARQPDVKLHIVGKDPAKEIRAVGSDPRVTVTGYVPDMRPYLAQATVAVCPVLYSAGIQNKVLEAMAMGTPVVATPQSCAALEVVHGENVLIAGEPEAFAQRVLELLDDEGVRETMGRNGRRYVEEHHDWRDVTQRLEEVYQEVIGRRQ